jgi:hypothetical protein
MFDGKRRDDAMPPKAVYFPRLDGVCIVVDPEGEGLNEVRKWRQFEEWLRRINHEMAQMMME